MMVVWNNTSGDVLTESQRRDYKSWLAQGPASQWKYSPNNFSEYTQ